MMIEVVRSDALTAEEYIYVGRAVCAIVKMKDIDHTAFRLLVSLLIDEMYRRDHPLIISARYLHRLTSIAIGRTLQAIARLEERGFISARIVGKKTKTYTIQKEHLCLPPLIDENIVIDGVAYHAHVFLERI